MHNLANNPIIGTQKSVYGDSPAGKLEKFKGGTLKSLPLQQGFYSDGKRSFPIVIYYLPTFWAFKEGIVGTAPITHSTAVSTPFGSVPTIRSIESDFFIKTPALKQLFKFVKRYPHDLLVGPFSERLEPFKVFNGDLGVISKSHVSDFFNDFSESIPDKISFRFPQFLKGSVGSMAAFISKRAKFLSPLKYFLSFNPDVLSEVGLFENLAPGGNNRHSETFCIDINSEHIWSFWESTTFFRNLTSPV